MGRKVPFTTASSLLYLWAIMISERRARRAAFASTWLFGLLASACTRPTESSATHVLVTPSGVAPATVASEFGRHAGRRPGGGGGACSGAAAGPEAFALYLLALSWAPEFCAGHPDKEECSPLSDFAATHLTLHGLWPNYDDAEAARSGCEYPEYCGAASSCASSGASTGRDACALDRSTIPPEMKLLGPGYVGDDDFLATHEWPKHGSCSGLSSRAYFAAGIAAMKSLGGESGTPRVLQDAIGASVTAAALVAGFAHPESILLGCNDGCEFTEVSVCLSHDAAGNPGPPRACPEIARRSSYDNGCIVKHCASVSVRKAGTRGEPSPQPSPQPNGACGHPGQGPSCTTDGTCVAAGFARCARSGCCTSVPRR